MCQIRQAPDCAFASAQLQMLPHSFNAGCTPAWGRVTHNEAHEVSRRVASLATVLMVERRNEVCMCKFFLDKSYVLDKLENGRSNCFSIF